MGEQLPGTRPRRRSRPRWGHRLESLPSARAEAETLLALLGQGRNTVDTIRMLIAIPPKIEDALRAHAAAYPKEARRIEAIIRFRRRVAEELDWLVATHPRLDGPHASG